MAGTGAWLGSATDFYKSSDLSMTYTDYLQRRELDDRLAFQITGSIKELITSNEHAFNAQIESLERIEAGQAQAAYEVVCAVKDLQEATEEGFRHVGSILDWGFSEVIFLLGRTNDLLSDIRNLLENRSLTWAYEQFNRARDRYRRGHYIEALESIDKAIHGHGTELGDKTEHRFHFLQGIIRLGSIQNNSPDIVDLAEAEQAFLLASKYAAHDFVAEAADALMCAAHAANNQGHYDDAAGHAEKGLRFRETAGLHYELARSLLQLARDDEAKGHLQWSIRLDKNLLLKAGGDPAFQVRDDFLKRTFEELLLELQELARNAEDCLQSDIAVMKVITYESTEAESVRKMSTGCSEVISDAEVGYTRLVSTRTTGGILELRLALECCYISYAGIASADSKFRLYIQNALQRRADQWRASVDRQLSERRRRKEQAQGLRDSMPVYVAFIICVIYAAVGISRGYIVEGVLGGPIFGAFAGWIASLVLNSNDREWSTHNQAIEAHLARVLKENGDDQRNAGGAVFFTPQFRGDQVVPIWARPALS